jgi:ABC-type bacteriocin/lantibiotic exporter with double-glycine peptidase domain
MVSVLFLLVLLFLVNWGVALSAALGIGSAYGLIFLLVRKRLVGLGERQAATSAERFRVAQEALGGIKDVKLNGLEAHYGARFDVPSGKFARILASAQLIGELPRFLLEAIAFG